MRSCEMRSAMAVLLFSVFYVFMMLWRRGLFVKACNNVFSINNRDDAIEIDVASQPVVGPKERR